MFCWETKPLLIDNKGHFRYFSLETNRQLALNFFSFWENLYLIFYSVFILGNLLQATAQILNIILQLYMWVIIIRALLSWVNPDPYNPIVQLLYSITEPVLNRIRQLIPMSGIGIDLSPIIVLLVIVFLQGFLVESLAALADKITITSHAFKLS